MELLKSAFCSAGEGSFRGKTDLQFYKRTREILLFHVAFIKRELPQLLRAQSAEPST